MPFPEIMPAVLGTIRNAQLGGLPPFALTLGLPRASLLVLQARIAAPWLPLVPADAAPPLFRELIELLTRYRAADADPQHAEWLAHAMACAAYGHGHLWQELGVARREDVAELLQAWFPGFFQRNTDGMRWKKFLFAELGAELGQPELRPPHCEGCEEFRICFPATRQR